MYCFLTWNCLAHRPAGRVLTPGSSFPLHHTDRTPVTSASVTKIQTNKQKTLSKDSLCPACPASNCSPQCLRSMPSPVSTGVRPPRGSLCPCTLCTHQAWAPNRADPGPGWSCEGTLFTVSSLMCSFCGLQRGEGSEGVGRAHRGVDAGSELAQPSEIRPRGCPVAVFAWLHPYMSHGA